MASGSEEMVVVTAAGVVSGSRRRRRGHGDVRRCEMGVACAAWDGTVAAAGALRANKG